MAEPTYPINLSDEVIGNIFTHMAWLLTKYVNDTPVSGDITIVASAGSRQSIISSGNITSVTCELTEVYPSVVLEIYPDVECTITPTGWKTPGGDSVVLPVGKNVIVLQLSVDGTTKYMLPSVMDLA